MKELPVILGPTGVGKSEVGLEVARRIGAEIISCDSRQVYQDMNIGTDKPSPAVLKEVMHWLIDVVPPTVRLNAWEYAKLARRKIIEIWARGKIPLVVGGSGLYLRALIDGFFGIQCRDTACRVPTIREKLESKLTSNLYARLKEIDSATALKLHPNDRVRIIRAIEVYEITGEPISELKKSRVPFDCNPIYIGLTMQRELLERRIDERVNRMMEKEFLDEVRELLKKYRTELASPEKLPVQFNLQTIGYKELSNHLRGEFNLLDAIKLIKRNTHRYAKRQLTWFKRMRSVYWIELPDPRIIEKCIKYFRLTVFTQRL